MPKNPGLITEFNGLWVRGAEDDCPPSHFTDCLNVRFTKAGVEQREGSSLAATYTNPIVRMAVYKPNPPYSAGNSPRLIWLDSAGNLFDSKFYPVAIFSSAAIKDFSMVNMFGRAYFTFTDGKFAIPATVIWVYDGTGVAGMRQAANGIPAFTLSGSILTGPGDKFSTADYYFGLCYETASGYITPPNNIIRIGATEALLQQAARLNIGTTGAPFVARWIIGTRGVPLSVSVDDIRALPYFFVSRITNNAQTTTDVTYYDTDLEDSADYLFDQFLGIPAGAHLATYGGRLIVIGDVTNPAVIRASKPGEPESFSQSSGFVTVDPTEVDGLRSGIEYRGTFYVFGAHRGYALQDTGDEASTWIPIAFDKSVGTEGYGIGQVLDAKGSEVTYFLIADVTGLYLFNGSFAQPELTYKIKDYWDRINKALFNLIQVNVDPIKQRIYVLAPLDASTYANTLIVGDYRAGLDPYKIKWSLWALPDDHMRSMAIFTDYSSGTGTIVTELVSSNKIYKLGEGLTADDATKITSYFELGPIRYGLGVSQFNRIALRAIGNATLSFTAYGEDKTVSVSPANLVLNNATPGREYAQIFNLVSEQCRMRIATNNLNDNFKINAINIEGKALWNERPR